MQLQDEQYMRVALEEARLALKEDELPVGVVITRFDEVIARVHKFSGCNIRLDHGEMLALQVALKEKDYDTKDVCLYSTLEPCPMCFGAILNCRIPRIVYALEDTYGGFASIFDPKQAPIRHQYEFPEVVGGVLRESARDMFREYFLTTKNSFWKQAKNNPLRRTCMV